MSPESNSKYAGPYRNPRADLYTMMLILSLIAILVGIWCLYLENQRYQFKFSGGPSVSRAAAGSGYAPQALARSVL